MFEVDTVAAFGENCGGDLLLVADNFVGNAGSGDEIFI